MKGNGRMLDLNKPPMGWNSYDYYDTTVTEDQVKANADYMAEHLKSHGWEYVVVDIEWYSYDAGSQRDKHQYIPFWKVEMDEYSRLLPCPQRFPSSAGGRGFAPLAEYVTFSVWTSVALSVKTDWATIPNMKCLFIGEGRRCYCRDGHIFALVNIIVQCLL